MTDDADAIESAVVSLTPDADATPGEDVSQLRAGRAPEGKRSGTGLATVIGGDDRIEIMATRERPWRMICALIGLRRGRPFLYGTGALIAPRVVLTAAHNLHDRLDAIEVIPARTGDRRPYGSQVVKRPEFRIHPVWKKRSHPDRASRDAAALILPQAFPGLEKSCFRLAMPDDDALKGWMLNIAGYPGKSPTTEDTKARELWFHSNGVKEAGAKGVTYAVDTSVGQSGAPVWVHPKPGAPATIVAIHAYGAEPNVPGMQRDTFNKATRIDADLVTHIKEWARV